MAPTGWTYYKEITIQDGYVDSNLTDFPFLVWFDNDGDIGTRARSDGYDLRFTVSPHGDANLLKYEREYFNISASQATGRFFVKIPSILATGGATIRCWYGKSDAGDGQDASNTWDDNFLAVYHLSEASGTVYDSKNSYDLTASGTPVYGESGKIHNCLLFDDSVPEYLQRDGTLSWAAPMTFEAWFKEDDATVNDRNMIQVCDKDVGDQYFRLCEDTNVVSKRVSVVINDGGVSFATTTNTYSVNTWNYAYARFISTTDHRVSLNNGTEAQNTTTRSPTGMDRINVGYEGDSSPDDGWSGWLDEVRISQIDRGADWLKFTYYNINEGDHEQGWGSEQSEGYISLRWRR